MAAPGAAFGGRALIAQIRAASLWASARRSILIDVVIENLQCDVRFGADPLDAPHQSGQHPAFRRPRGIEMDGMNGSCLAEAVHAPDALFEADRIPRQLEVDDQPAVALKVQALGPRVGGEEQIGAAGREGLDREAAFVTTQATVKQDRAPETADGRVRLEPHQRVAVFGKHDERLAHASQQPSQRRNLPLVRRGARGGRQDAVERHAFVTGPVEGRRREQRCGIREVVIGV